ncbi:MAG: Gfo/Idh/MocA family protein [Anaerolineae bacterium]
MAFEPLRVGIMGCGTISGIYLQNSKLFDAFDIVAVADTRLNAAQARADEYGVAKAYTPEQLLADPDVELVINLTPHHAHGPVALSILEAGKHVYNEKPLAVYREEAQKMFAAAEARNLLIGCAPDTFMGGAWQTARHMLDEGVIGEPVGASACLMARRGPRPGAAPRPANPDGYVSFYRTSFFQFGVTWSFDRGPYYLHALINLLGPVSRVTGSAQITWKEREDIEGMVKVDTPTHFAGVFDFVNGAVGTFLVTSDFYDTGLPHIEIYGSKGSLRCIDPNNFGGELYLRKADSPELIPIESKFAHNQNSRGIGVADMAAAIRCGRPHRANGKMAYHVIDIIHALHEASAEGRHIMLESTCERPAPLPQDLPDWKIDE